MHLSPNTPVPEIGLSVDLAELPEAGAAGEKARIYAEIRRLGGVPMVALIYRHLATLPGALEWMWEAVSPAWRSGEIPETAWRVAREVPLDPIAPLSPSTLAGLGVNERGLVEIRAVVESYDRANPENLLTVLCLLRLLPGQVASREASSAPWIPPVAPGPLVPMGDLQSLTPEMAELLARVAGPSPPGGARVVQSLYRHFLHRPAFLEWVVMSVAARIEDGAVDRASARIHAGMSRAADEIVSTLRAPPAPHPGIEAACSRFAAGIIPRMIVVGRLLRAALPD